MSPGREMVAPTSYVCRDYAHLLSAFVDGELETGKQLEIGSHIESCEGCRERVLLEEAMRGSLKQACRKETETLDRAALRLRVAAAMRGEAGRVVAREDHLKKGAAWRTIVPLATAAAFAMAWSAMSKGPLARTTGGTSVHAGFGDDLLAELVAEHSKAPPPQLTNPDDVNRMGQFVGVPVHPSSFQHANGGARFVGGRVVPVHDERAAMLQYEISNGGETRRVSIIVFDPRRIQINDAELQARPVGSAQVRTGHSNGYSVAVTQRAGVGYALASDMDEGQTAELAVATGD